jgi:hypothetical protein
MQSAIGRDSIDCVAELHEPAFKGSLFSQVQDLRRLWALEEGYAVPQQYGMHAQDVLVDQVERCAYDVDSTDQNREAYKERGGA